MLNKSGILAIRQQCHLLNVNRSRVYYKAAVIDDKRISDAILAIYQCNPVYGYRRVNACLKRQGYQVNGKCVLRLMREMGIQAIYPGPLDSV